MSDPDPTPPLNAFTRTFLARAAARDQPATAAEADLLGPWKIERAADGSFVVLRGWESLAAGDLPRFAAAEREDALYAAAAMPAAGRPDLYRLRSEPDDDGAFAVERQAGPAGRCPHFDAELVAGMHVLRATGLSPQALASFLEAVGHAPLEQAGRILARRLAAGDGGTPAPPP
jgi:hypothetical protein